MWREGKEQRWAGKVTIGPRESIAFLDKDFCCYFVAHREPYFEQKSERMRTVLVEVSSDGVGRETSTSHLGHPLPPVHIRTGL